VYSVLGQISRFLIAHAFGWHPFSFHIAGTLYGVSVRVCGASA
jgi:hypothetical protein